MVVRGNVGRDQPRYGGESRKVTEGGGRTLDDFNHLREKKELIQKVTRKSSDGFSNERFLPLYKVCGFLSRRVSQVQSLKKNKKYLCINMYKHSVH